MVVGICDVPEIVHLQEKRAASGKVEPENTTTETVPEDGQMKRPDDPPEPTKDLWWPWLRSKLRSDFNTTSVLRDYLHRNCTC